jgi:small-conductance mechanosensitive channel
MLAIVLSALLPQAARPDVAVEPDATQSTPAKSPVSFEMAPSPVVIDGRPVLIIYAPLAGVSPEERADIIRDRILRFARDRTLPVESIHSEERGPWAEIRAGEDTVMAVTESDAVAAGRSRVELAGEYAEVIRRAVTLYRQEHTLAILLRGALYTLFATVAVVLILFALFRTRRFVRNRLETLVRGTDESLPPQSFRSRFARLVFVPLIGTGIIVVTAAAVVILEIYATLVLSFFPSTRYLGYRLNRWTLSELGGFGHDLWAYLPNLVIVVIVLIAARVLIRVNHFFFQEVGQGTVTVRGFYPDWAQPTAKLVRLLIFAVTAVVIFPYLPGSNSPAFRGISVFLGVLLSLGSTSAVAHGVAGTILTYMRSFRVGDFVKIGDTVGEVVERTLLVTRICTQKKEIVTIPNGSVLGGIVVNYSAEAKKQGVIFYTKVSIGYTAPWQTVCDLLVSAALATKDISEQPRPFVLQSSLDDFYVSYELNAFTVYPENMQYIYSDLHQNIQDRFNEGGIEINSPHYFSLRDGNQVAIPKEFLPKSYQPPPFGFREVGGGDGSAAARASRREKQQTGAEAP